MSGGEGAARALSDISTLVSRGMLRYRRAPDVLAVLLFQPLLILLLYRYVFAGQLRIPHYTQYLMPGILSMAVLMGSATMGIGLAEDLTSGLIDQWRALPITRSAFLTARAVTDIQRNTVIVPATGLLGVVVGFHVVGSAPRVLLAAVLLLALGWAFTWLSMNVALWTGSVEATQGLMFLIAVVFAFASSGFVTVASMPAWLQPAVKLSPVTFVDNAVRVLTTTVHGAATHDVVGSLISIGVLLIVLIPLALARYSRYAS